MMSDDTTIIPSLVPSALVEKFEGEFVVHIPGGASTYRADALAVVILSYCNGKNNIATIIKRLVSLYPGQDEVIAQDIPKIIEEMVDLGILQT